MKKFSKVLTILLAITMLLTSARSVHADPTDPPTPGVDTVYKPKEGESITFKKFLITEIGQVVPDLTFTYKIEAGQSQAAVAPQNLTAEKWYLEGNPSTKFDTEEGAKAARKSLDDITEVQVEGVTKYAFNGTNYDTYDDAQDALAAYNVLGYNEPTIGTPGKFEVKAGIDPNKVTVSTAVFTDLDPDANNKLFLVAPADEGLILEDEEVYSKRPVTVDFSGVYFTEPGVYRYILTEQLIDGVDGISYDTQRKVGTEERVRVIDVYVVDDETSTATSPKLAIAGTVMHEVKTTVNTTYEMGSKDERATIATAWKLPENLPTTPRDYNTFVSNPYTDKKIALQALSTLREKVHDDIVSENAKIANLELTYETAKSEYEAQAATAGITALKDAYDTAVLNREAAEQQKDSLLAQLKQTTIPSEITRIRGLIDDLDAADTEEGSIAYLQKLENAAKLAYDTAVADLKTYEDAMDSALDALNAQKKLVNDLQTLYYSLSDDCIVEVAWELSDKSDNYVNEVEPVYDLQFHKKVTGNQGSRDKYFKYSLTIEDVKPNALYTYDGTYTEAPSKTPATIYDAKTMKLANSYDADPDFMTYADTAEGKEFDYLDPTEFVWVDATDTDLTYEYDSANSEWVRMKTGYVEDANGTWYQLYAGTYTETAPDSSTQSDYYDFTNGTIYKYSEARIEDATWTGDEPPTTATYTGMAGKQLKADSTGKITHDFYLKHDEFIRVYDLKKNSTYTVTEVNEDYMVEYEYTDKKAYPTGSERTIVAYSDAITELETAIDAETDPVKKAELETKKANLDATRRLLLDKIHNDQLVDGTLDSNKFVGYTNRRDGIIPTGVMAAAGTGALIVGAGIIGMLVMGRKKEEEDEE